MAFIGALAGSPTTVADILAGSQPNRVIAAVLISVNASGYGDLGGGIGMGKNSLVFYLTSGGYGITLSTVSERDGRASLMISVIG